MEDAVLEEPSKGIQLMAGAVEASNQVIRLVRDNEDIAHHADGCTPAVLARAEQELGLAFPPSYRRLLEEFGTWDIAGTEFPGVYRTAVKGDQLLGTVEETLSARENQGLPTPLMVVKTDDVWMLVVLDTSQSDQSGEYAVYAWNPGVLKGGAMERIADNFGSFALTECHMAVTQWRNMD
ncbi:SMI1/KNR4 family protein [Streptomyces sp. NPDC000351]|uniref:SMI1/KNR4 family protein n=1 Tax=Streptomyces sp. NPDC000351 TaxID=3154250 RepID=UPI003329D687